MDTLNNSYFESDLSRYDAVTLGSYYSNIFNIKLNLVSGEIDLKRIIRDLSYVPIMDSNTKISATFLHEYAHYLQDLLTVAGLANFIHMADCVNDFRIQANSLRMISTPMSLTYKPVLIDKTLKKEYSGKNICLSGDTFDSIRLKSINDKEDDCQLIVSIDSRD